MDFGKVAVLPGKTPPAITPLGTFNEGDPLTATIFGLLTEIGFYFSAMFTEQIGMFMKGGFHYAFLQDLEVKAGEVILNTKAPSLIKPDGSSTHADIDPKGKSLGGFGFIGGIYKF